MKRKIKPKQVDFILGGQEQFNIQEFINVISSME